VFNFFDTHRHDELFLVSRIKKMATRPSFDRAWAAFMVVRVPVKDVGKIIGGY
jgi:hypothetical protein